MSLPLIALFGWVILAHILALIPSRDNHWARAYLLIALGIPLLGWVTAAHGPVVGLLALAGGASVLRWPLIFLWRWLRRTARPGLARASRDEIGGGDRNG